MDADVREWCRCGVLVFECGRGTMAQHDERIKALADRELARRPATPPFERDEFLRVVALSPQAAQAFAGREDEPEDLGPPVYPDRYAPGARVWGFRAAGRPAAPATASNAEPSCAPSIRLQAAGTCGRKASIHFPGATRDDNRAGTYYPAADVEVRAWRRPGDDQVMVEVKACEDARNAEPVVNLWADELVALGALAEVTLANEPEIEDPSGHFENPEDVTFARTASDGNDWWPWCSVTVRAEWLGFRGEAHLGACSYHGEDDFKRPGGYYDALVREALGNLRDQIKAAGEAIDRVSRGRS